LVFNIALWRAGGDNMVMLASPGLDKKDLADFIAVAVNQWLAEE